MNQEVWRYRQRMDHLFRRSGLVKDTELQSHWARYLCVMTSGFVEVSVRALYSQYARDKAAPSVANFVEERLKSFQNAKMNNICDLTREFNSGWADELAAKTAGELKDAVDSVVANRHLIAHGRDVGITYVRIKDYYERTVKVIDILRSWCDP